jgi:hypothetical protein
VCRRRHSFVMHERAEGVIRENMRKHVSAPVRGQGGRLGSGKTSDFHDARAVQKRNVRKHVNERAYTTHLNGMMQLSCLNVAGVNSNRVAHLVQHVSKRSRRVKRHVARARAQLYRELPYDAQTASGIVVNVVLKDFVESKIGCVVPVVVHMCW